MPKKLLIVRHAKAEDADFQKADFKRSLSTRGKNDIPKMAARLVRKGIIPQRFISSPALRAISTARYFAIEMGLVPLEIIQDPEIYDALTFNLLEMINKLDDDTDFVALFGHNPSITQLVNHLCDEHIDNIPTCGMALMDFPFDTWKMLSMGTGVLVYFDFPKNTEL